MKITRKPRWSIIAQIEPKCCEGIAFHRRTYPERGRGEGLNLTGTWIGSYSLQAKSTPQAPRVPIFEKAEGCQSHDRGHKQAIINGLGIAAPHLSYQSHWPLCWFCCGPPVVHCSMSMYAVDESHESQFSSIPSISSCSRLHLPGSHAWFNGDNDHQNILCAD